MISEILCNKLLSVIYLIVYSTASQQADGKQAADHSRSAASESKEDVEIETQLSGVHSTLKLNLIVENIELELFTGERFSTQVIF